MTITNVKYTDLDHTQVRITLDDGREMFAGAQGATWLHTELTEWRKNHEIESFMTTQQLLDKMLTDKLAEVQAEKVKVRDGGMLVDGVLWDTDSQAQAAYQRFFIGLSSNPSLSVSNWRASKDIVKTMDAVMFQKIMVAWQAHEAGCFLWQDQKDGLLKLAHVSGNLTTLQGISTKWGE